MVKFFLNNKEWIFSGIGVAVAATLINIFFGSTDNVQQQNQSGNNIQTNGNITIQNIEYSKSIGVILDIVDFGAIENEKNKYIEPNTLDIKLKNSGDESAYIHGVKFKFYYYPRNVPQSYVPGNTYQYDFVILDNLHFNIKEKSSYVHVNESINSSAILKVSQEVPPKGIDRIIVKFVGNKSFTVRGEATLLYDKNKEIFVGKFTVGVRPDKIFKRNNNKYRF